MDELEQARSARDPSWLKYCVSFVPRAATQHELSAENIEAAHTHAHTRCPARLRRTRTSDTPHHYNRASTVHVTFLALGRLRCRLSAHTRLGGTHQRMCILRTPSHLGYRPVLAGRKYTRARARAHTTPHHTTHTHTHTHIQGAPTTRPCTHDIGSATEASKDAAPVMAAQRRTNTTGIYAARTYHAQR